MKRAFLWILAIEVLVILLLPALLVRGLDLEPRPGGSESKSITSAVNVRVLVHSTGRIEEMPLEEYVLGVVAAEMPASFGMEALKAQTVAARTYVARRMTAFGGPGCSEHPGADICTDPSHAQAWMSREEMRKAWGVFNFERYYTRLEEAVSSTAGLVMTYNDQPVDPVYHSTSGGPTEDASEVWQGAVPYLKSVPCDYCRHSPYYSHVMEMSLEELGTRLKDRDVPVFLQSGKGRPEIAATSATGRVKALRLAKTVIRGQDIRSVLGLPSTRFTAEIRGRTVVFTLRGKGHGVGMCQYGADGMAKEGKSFRDILTYYYTGVKIRNMFEE